MFKPVRFMPVTPLPNVKFIPMSVAHRLPSHRINSGVPNSSETEAPHVATATVATVAPVHIVMPAVGAVRCFFNRDIIPAILALVTRQDTVFVVGCAAWFSNGELLRSFRRKEGVCILTMSVSGQIQGLRGIHGNGPFREIKYSGDQLMHHKFLIGLTPDLKPQWIVTGSFNFTKRAAEVNDENITIFTDADILGKYMMEFNRLFDLSVPITAPTPYKWCKQT